MKRKIAVIYTCFGFGTILFAADPFIGTWKLDAGKSTGTIPNDETVVIETQGAQMLVQVSIPSSGPREPPVSITFTAPIKGGTGHVLAGPFDGALLQRSAKSSMELSYLTGGKTVRSMRVVVNKDGKRMTSTGHGIDGVGKPLKWTMVFVKQ